MNPRSGPASFAGAAILATALVAAPALAQSGGGSDGGSDAGSEPPLSKQLDETLRALIEQMQPAWKNLRETLEVFEKIDSLKYYKRPEILPNGDIIIRRRPDAPPWTPPPDEEGGVKT